MIVEPDFLSHWKTLMLINELGDKCAPLYVLSLWAHCQQRRSDTFHDMAPNALKAICRYEGEASKLRSALERCGFIDVEGEAVVVHGWSDLNCRLVAQWTNGAKGGRPNPKITQQEPKKDLGYLNGTDRKGKVGKEKKSRPPPEVVSEWNRNSPPLPEVKAFTADRERHLGARMAEQFFSENWRTGIERILKTPFCLGVNDKGWKADIDWFLQPGSLAKILEGKYDDRAKPPASKMVK